jgi:glycosyltransferase involved in cell wall biosynthesis
MKTKPVKPNISIGMPVYNGAKTIEKTINSLLAQTFKDFELIISDNASDDETENICQKFAGKDSRIHYIRQDKNIGLYQSENFLLSKATGKYFMFSMDDDLRSPDFLELNVTFLDSNLKFVASTSPNCHEGEENMPEKYIDFNLEGTLKERYVKFLQNSWRSHGIFFSLIRTEVIKDCKHLNFSYAGTDWSVNFFLLSKGEINRTKGGLIVLGRNGISQTDNPWKKFRNKSIEFFIPLYEFTKCALVLMKNLNFFEWMQVFVKLLKVNFQAARSNYKITIRELFNDRTL